MLIRRRIYFCLLTYLLLAAVPTLAQSDHGTTLLGSGFTGQPFVIEGDVVLETDSLNDAIRDFSDLHQPEIVGWHDHSQTGFWFDVLVDDGLMVALRDQIFPFGVDILDASDPTALVSLAEIQGNPYTSGWLRDGVLVLAMPTYCVIYDLADPTAPTFSSIVLTGELETSRWFSASGSTLYLIDEAARLRALDMTNPLHPVDLGKLWLSGDRIDAMVAAGSSLHVLLANAGDLALVTYDVSLPLAPVETARFTFATDGGDLVGTTLVIDDDLLLAATSDDQVTAFGVADPAHPAPGWSVSHASDHLAISETKIFVATPAEVVVYERSDYLTPPPDSIARKILPRLRGVVGEGSVQVVFDYHDKSLLAALDVSSPALPVLGEWFDTGLDGGWVYADELALMITPESKGRLIGLSDPTMPEILGDIESPVMEFDAAVLSRRATVIATNILGTENLIYDLEDLYAPALVGVVGHGLPASLQDDLLLLRDNESFNLVDLTNLTDPILKGSVNFKEPIRSLDLYQDHVYATVGEATPYDLFVVAVSDPTDPVVVAQLSLDYSGWRMAFHADRFHLTSYSQTRIYDISDPPQITEAGRYETPGEAGYGVAFNGNEFTHSGWLIIRRDDGFDVTDVPGADFAACRLQPAYPNPFNPSTTISFTVERTRDLTVTIHDVRGRRVADLASGAFAPGRHTLQWHGQDAGGHNVSSGVYLVRLHGAGVEASQTVTLIK